MLSILIVESNTPEIVAGGKAGATGFLHAFAGLAPDASIAIAAPYAGPVSDAAFDTADGVVFTGAGVDWATDAPQAAPLRAVMERVFARGLPTWGSCNGMQLAAVVLGGAVGASPKGIEVGLARDTELTPQGRAHPMFTGRDSRFAVPCIHRDEVQRLPEGAVLLAGNAHSPVQAMSYDVGGIDFWGAQYHPELMPRDIAQYLRTKPAADPGLIADLEAAEHDDAAARRIGAAPGTLGQTTRTRELANWLAHVAAKKITLAA